MAVRNLKALLQSARSEETDKWHHKSQSWGIEGHSDTIPIPEDMSVVTLVRTLSSFMTMALRPPENYVCVRARACACTCARTCMQTRTHTHSN